MHEYGHAIVHSLAPWAFSSLIDETIYLKEGLSFYWAAAMNDSADEANNYPSTKIYEGMASGRDYEELFLYDLDHERTYPCSLLSTDDPEHTHRNG